MLGFPLLANGGQSHVQEYFVFGLFQLKNGGEKIYASLALYVVVVGAMTEGIFDLFRASITAWRERCCVYNFFVDEALVLD